MEISIMEILAIILGILIRLVVPITLTILLAVLLRRLDKRWQKKADLEWAEIHVQGKSNGESRPCWELHNCPKSLRSKCKAHANPSIPCWEIHRIEGRLKPACRNCKVKPTGIPEHVAVA